MKMSGLVRIRAILASMFILALSVSLSGCQDTTPRALPTPTHIPLGSPVAAEQSTRAIEITIAAPVTPATVLSATASPTPVSLPTTASIPTEGMMALGTQATVTLRAQAAANAAVVAQVPGSQVLWAKGRNTASDWLWVTYNEAGRHAWVAAKDVKLTGDISSLTDIMPGASAKAVPTAPAIPAATPTPSGASAAVPPPSTPTLAAPAITTAPTLSPTRTPIPPTPLPGKIAFHTAIGGEIYIVNADGTGLRRLANGFDPALSPDGTQLAFVRWGPPDGLYLLDLRTGEEKQLFTTQQPRGPAWSPDGSKIVLSHNTLKTTCLDTPLGCFAEEDVQSFFNGQECIDTPQGRFCIADFPRLQLDLTDLAQVTVADTGWLDLPSQRRSQTPSWHPKRNEILYAGWTGLQTLPLGEATRPLVDDVTLGSASWSPDAQRIVAQTYKHDRWDIVLLDAAGNILAQLTSPDPLSPQKPNNVAPAWSPDGRSILFLSDRSGAWRMYRMNADGSGQALFLPQALSSVTFSYNFAADRVISWSK